MRQPDEWMFWYPRLDPGGRRYALCRLADLPPGADLQERTAFLAQRAVEESGILGAQALACLAELAPRRPFLGAPPAESRLVGVSLFDDASLDGVSPSAVGSLALALGAGPRLVSRLADPSGRGRTGFALALGLSHRPSAHAPLLHRLEGENLHAGQWPLLLLQLRIGGGDLPTGPILPTLDADTLVSLLWIMRHHPDRDWGPLLDSAGRSTDLWAAVHAVAALEHSAGPRAKERSWDLYALLEDPTHKAQALRALSRTEGPTLTEAVVTALSSAGEALLAVALEVTLRHRLGDVRILPLVERLVGHEAPRVRALALAIVGESGAPSAIQELRDLASDEDPSMRLEAGVALGWVTDARATQALHRMATADPSRTVASTAIRVLQGRPGTLPVDVLRLALARPGSVADAAAQVLLERAAAAPGEVFEVLGSDPPAGPGLEALGAAVVASGSHARLSVLADACQAAARQDSPHAARALYALGSAAPSRVLQTLLAHAPPRSRAHAASAAILAGDARGVDTLRTMALEPAGLDGVADAIIDLASVLGQARGHPLFRNAVLLVAVDAPSPASEATPAPLADSGPARAPVTPVTEPGRLPDGRRDDSRGPDRASGAAPAPGSPRADATPSRRSRTLRPASLPSAWASALYARAMGALATFASGEGAMPAGGAGLLWATILALALGAVLATVRETPRETPVGVSSGQGMGSPAAPHTLAFHPSVVVATSLRRSGSGARPFLLSDRFMPGDEIEALARGGAWLSTLRGSVLTLDSSACVGMTPHPGRDVQSIVLVHKSGHLELTWRERHTARVEVASGVLEVQTAEISVEDERIEVRSGRARWHPRSGSPAWLDAPARIDRQSASGGPGLTAPW